MSNAPAILRDPGETRQPPQRAFILLANFDADTREALAWKLRDFARRIEVEGFTGRSIGGGGGAGHIAELFENPAMVSGDQYFAALDAYLKEVAASERTVGGKSE